MTVYSGTRFAALSRARSLVRHHSADTPAVQRLKDLARTLGVSSVEPESMHSCGSVTRSNDGNFHVRYSDKLRLNRRNFTIAHELGHIVLDQLIPHIGQMQPVERTVASERYIGIERLVDRLAAELLMPEQTVADALCSECVQQRSEGASRIRYWDAVKALRIKLEVSETALLLRLRELPQLKSVRVRVACGLRSARRGWANAVVRHSTGVRVIPSPSRPKSFARFLEKCADGAYHDITLRSRESSSTRVLPCQGWTRKLETDSGKLDEYCILGWTWSQTPIPYYDDAR